MKVDDLYQWNCDPMPIEGDELQCPKCKEWTSHNEWEETEIYCEDCGSHLAMKCPKCKEYLDNVYSDRINTRTP